MLLGQLVAYAERLERENLSREEQDAVVPSGYQMQAIKGFIKLDKEGNFLEIYPTSGGDGKKKDAGLKFPAPSLKKSVNIRSRLLVENAEYVLGIPRKADDPKVPLRHQAFIQELENCHRETQVESIAPILAFLRNLDLEKVKSRLWEKFDPTQNLSFDVEGIKPFTLPEI